MIELLVVIAVLGILAAILIPVVSKVRSTARSTHCVSNLQQIGRALTVYAQDNRSRLPAPVDGSSVPWFATLHPYVGSPWSGIEQLNPVFTCPSWSLQDRIATDSDIGYAYSAIIAGMWNPGYAPALANIQHPSRTVLVIESPTAWNTPFFPTTDTPESLGSYLTTVNDLGCDRHDGAANYLFADGHVGHLTPNAAEATLPK